MGNTLNKVVPDLCPPKDPFYEALPRSMPKYVKPQGGLQWSSLQACRTMKNRTRASNDRLVENRTSSDCPPWPANREPAKGWKTPRGRPLDLSLDRSPPCFPRRDTTSLGCADPARTLPILRLPTVKPTTSPTFSAWKYDANQMTTRNCGPHHLEVPGSRSSPAPPTGPKPKKWMTVGFFLEDFVLSQMRRLKKAGHFPSLFSPLSKIAVQCPEVVGRWENRTAPPGYTISPSSI